MTSSGSLVGKQIDQFRLDEFIAKGGMGLVYKARDTVLDRTVVLKLIPKAEDVTPAMSEARHRLIKEARAAAGLFHDNIVTIFSYGETDAFQYIAMEYVIGKTLAQLLTERVLLPPEEAVPIFVQILLALEAAHKQDIVHRDIKPANIMLTEGGRVKVMDFGIAKVGSHSTTMTGMILGTPRYMAPEQVKGDKTDIRSDIFAVGTVLYEVLTGARPFEADTITSLMYKILEEEPVAPTILNENLPPALEQVIRKALAKNPAERWQTPDEMRQALVSWIEEGRPESTATARPVSLKATPPRPARLDFRTGPDPGGAGLPKKQAGTAARGKKAKFYVAAGIIILALLGLFFFVSKPFPDTLIAIRFQHNGQELLAAAGSTVTVSPEDTIQLLQVKTNGWLSTDTKIESPGMNAQAISEKPVAVRDLFQKQSFDDPISTELRVLARGSLIGKVSLLVKPDARDWQLKANASADPGKKIEYLEKALRMDSSNLSVKAQLADLYFDGKRYPDAARLYTELNQSVKSRTVTERVIQTYQAMNRPDEALAAYIDLLGLSEDQQTFNQFIAYLRKSKSKDEAQAFLDRHQGEIPKAFRWSLIVQSNPAGVAVFVDGALKGNSPLTVSGLAPGPVKVRVSLEGYKDQEKEMEVLAGGEITADFTLASVEQPPAQQRPIAPPPVRDVIETRKPAIRSGMVPAVPKPVVPAVPKPVSPLRDKVRRKPGAVDVSESTATSGAKQTYAVQAGIFRKKEDAEKLQRSLAGKGHHVSISTIASPKGGTLYSVTSGPVDSHAKASALSDSIRRDGKTRPVILKTDPTRGQ